MNVELLPREKNPFHHYNRTQVRRILRGVRLIETGLAKGTIGGQKIDTFGYHVGDGICAYMVHSRPSRGAVHLLNIDWTHWPQYSGHVYYPVPAPPPSQVMAEHLDAVCSDPMARYRHMWQAMQAAKAAVKTYHEAECTGEQPMPTVREVFEMQVAFHNQDAAHSFAFNTFSEQARWSSANPYGAARLHLLQWIKVHALYMQHLLTHTKGRAVL